MKPAINLADAGARRAWLDQLRADVLDLVAIGEDAAKPYRARTFSRHEARRRLAESERALLAHLDAAGEPLRPRPMALVPSPDPEGSCPAREDRATEPPPPSSPRRTS